MDYIRSIQKHQCRRLSTAQRTLFLTCGFMKGKCLADEVLRGMVEWNLMRYSLNYEICSSHLVVVSYT